VLGQETSVQVEHFSVEEGLVDRRVRCVLEHSNGFVYVGTANGLSRFDGYTFTDIDIDKSESEWQGLYIVALHEISDGSILMFAYPSFGFKYDEETTLVYLVNPLTNSVERSRELENLPFPMVVTGDTLYTINGKQRFIGSETTDASGNRLYINGTPANPGDTALLTLYDSRVVDLSDPIQTTGSFTQVYSTDYSKVIYVATNNAGMLVISIDVPLFEQILSTDIQDWQYDLVCRGLTEYKGDLIIGTDKGIFRWDKDLASGEQMVFEISDRRPTRRVRSFQLLENDTMLVAGQSGLAKLNMTTRQGRIERPDKRLEYADQALRLINGEIVVSGRTEEGRLLIFYDSRGEVTRILEFKDLGFNGGFVESVLFQDSRGMLWVGTTLGLFEIDIVEERIVAFYAYDFLDSDSTSFPVYHCLGSNHIISLAENNGKIWIGHYDEGIDILDPATRDARRISVESGLNSNSVCGLLPDSSGMWIGTFNGLAYYNQRNGSLSTFSSRNGLSHSEFNRWSGYVDSTGKFFIGTMNGVTGFRPDNVFKSAKRPKVLLSEVGFYGKGGREQVTLTSGFDSVPEFIIPSANRSFNANVALSDMRNALESSYRYRLISGGITTEWRNNGNDRQVRFEHLPAGVHKLEIDGVSANGISAQSLSITLNVQEFFYLRWWFIVSCIAVVAGIIALIYRYRLQQAIKVERLRTRLSSDLHDDVGGLLSGVAFQMELLDRTVDEKHKTLVRRVAESSRKAMVRMRDVVWAIDSRNSSYGDLVLRMQEYANEQLAPLGIEFILTSKGIKKEEGLSAEVRHGLILIFKEFVTNSIKHADASKVVLKVVRSRGEFLFSIGDDGNGADLTTISSGQGLENMRMRTKRMGGQIEIRSDDGFKIDILLNRV